MKKLLSLLVVALAFCINTPVSAETDATEVSLKENQVVYDYENEMPVTNGRVAITFNENEMTLVKADAQGLFDVEDVNTLMPAEDGMKTVYFAFASADYVDEKAVALTLVFDVKEGMEGKDITIKTEFEELSKDGELVDLDKLVDVVSVPNKDTPTDPKPVKPGVDTSDSSHIAMYLGMFAVASIALIVFVASRKKTCK